MRLNLTLFFLFIAGECSLVWAQVALCCTIFFMSLCLYVFKCEHWVHATEMCSGFPQRVIDAILEYDGRGISFVCTKCRIRSESSSTGNTQPLMIELMDQLFQQLRGLCSTVHGLVEQVKTPSTKPPPEPTPAPPLDTRPLGPPSPSEDQRSIIRREIKELNEINKRRNSIIVKGLSADSPRDLAQKFSALSQEVLGTPVTLNDVTPVPNQRNIFRAKILDDSARKQILDKAKTLRDSAYDGVFISCDLTYAQRAEQFARRQARRAETNGPSNLSAAFAVNPAPIPKLTDPWGPPARETP